MEYNLGLVPCPQFVERRDGYFTITEDTCLIVQDAKAMNYKWLVSIQENIRNEIGIHVSIGSKARKEGGNIFLIQEETVHESKDAYELIINEQDVTIKGQISGLFYGGKTLKQLIKTYKNKLPTIKIEDKPAFHHRGWMIDITRGKVPKVEYLMEIVDLAAEFKINQIQLYMEHTFAFDFTSEINVGKDGFNAEDIIILDAYCREQMIELVPCIATMGHLYEILKSDSYQHLCEYEDYPNEPYDWMKRQLHHSIDCNNPEALAFVKRVLENFLPLFSSSIVNICGDETFDIGKGKNKELAEQVGATKLYIDFLKKVMTIVQDMGRKVMFFGDVIIRNPEYFEELPKDVICMNWNYEPDVTEEETRFYKQAGVIQYICPGTTGWNRALNDYEGAFLNITKLIGYGHKYGADGVLTTDWGDFGHINCLSTSLPALILGATLSWNTEDPSCTSIRSFHEAISKQFGFDGMEHLNPFPLLVEISSKSQVTWEHLMKWYYDVAFDNVAYGEYHDHIIEPDCSFFRDIMAELETLINQLEENKSKAYSKLPISRRRDLEETIHMAKLIKLWQHYALMIKEFYFYTGDSKVYENLRLREEALRLAIQLEKWQLHYEKLWRIRNKESELYRIREVMTALCHYLRVPEIYQR